LVGSNIAGVDKASQNKKVVLTGTVTGSAALAAMWTVSPPIVPSLSLISLMNPVMSISAADAGSAAGYNTNLALSGSYLVPGRSYTFRLTAAPQISSAVATTYAEIVVTANAPPSGGVLEVTPSTGTALMTMFSMFTGSFSDDVDDYPL
jgi:hypothetical protein